MYVLMYDGDEKDPIAVSSDIDVLKKTANDGADCELYWRDTFSGSTGFKTVECNIMDDHYIIDQVPFIPTSSLHNSKG